MSKRNVDLHSGEWCPPDWDPVKKEWRGTQLVPAQPVAEAEKLDAPDDRPEVGSWWWVKPSKDDEEHIEESTEYDEDDPGTADRYDRGRQWLGCVIRLGSNFAIVEGVRFSLRLSLDEFHTRCLSEANPQAFIDEKIGKHRDRVRALMGEIKKVCAQLGVPMHQALAEAESTNHALAIAHGTADVKKYRNALVKAKDKTLPELFAKVKEQHTKMAVWMKAELIPAEAELTRAKEVKGRIEDKIHMVELYAGLTEELVCLKDGDPASVDVRVHLMQRRCYMDEECLARYEAGGMDFEDLKKFGTWISRDENMTRILPHERCIVAMRVRRYDKEYYQDGDRHSLDEFIRFGELTKANRKTFLFIRNGRQLWCLSTAIEFDAELFPRREDADLLGDDELWIRQKGADDYRIITGRQRASYIESWKERCAELAAELRYWKSIGKPDGEWLYPPDTSWTSRIGWQRRDNYAKFDIPGYENADRVQGYRRGKPSADIDEEWKEYARLTPEHIFYDDAMAEIAKQTAEHNRLAVVLQGLLDRSTCLHPHPPWRIWTPEGFAAGIELVYDASLALVEGPEKRWEEYRAQLNKSLRVGATVLGQRHAWHEMMEDKYGERRHWPDKEGCGPDTLDEIKAIRGGKARFDFSRRRERARWVPADEPGYFRQSYSGEIEMTFWCPLEALTCIDAYTPGDYRMFFDDPRTRAAYLKWAPVMLRAEDWHATRRTAPDESKEPEGKAPTKQIRVHLRGGYVTAHVPLDYEEQQAKAKKALEAARKKCPGRKHEDHLDGKWCKGNCCPLCGSDIDDDNECKVSNPRCPGNDQRKAKSKPKEED